MPKPPELAYDGLVFPTILAIREHGGLATIVQIEDSVARILSLGPEVLSYPTTSLKDTRSEFQYRLAWVRTSLKNVGAVDNDATARWSLTNYGKSITESEAKEVFRKVRADQRARRKRADELHAVMLDEVSERLAKTTSTLKAAIDVPYAGQRPATFRFSVQSGKLTAEAFNASLSERDATALYEQLKASAAQLNAVASGANSPITALIGSRTSDLLRALGESSTDLSAGDLLALWSTFDSFSALLSTEEGIAETSLAVRHLVTEVLQRLSALASLSGRVRELLAYRNAMSFDEKAAKDFDFLQRELASITSLETFTEIVDTSVIEALALHEGRKQDALATADTTADIDVRARANQDATDIRKLQALDASNLASGLAEGITSTPLPSDANWRTAWSRFNARLATRLPEELADAVSEVSATTLKSAPALGFAFLGAMAQPVYGALLGLAPILFKGPAKRLKEVLPLAED